jgi:hypothetical protein
MDQTPIRKIVRATTVSEGAGVTVHRTIGTEALRRLDPFLMLDFFNSDNPDEYIAGFPDHPHRGFITLTYMLDGHLLHQDSMGNRGDLRSGSIQWMKAASGVIHSEMPQQIDGLMRGFQLWINLPAREKMSDPEYQELPAARIPVVSDGGNRIKIVSGEFNGTSGPISDPHTRVSYYDVTLTPSGTFHHKLEPDMNAFAYVFEGTALSTGTHIPTHALAVLETGRPLTIAAENEGARFILVSGRPLNEPVAQYGPFVMNTEQEIHRAIDDFRNNRLVTKRANIAS